MKMPNPIAIRFAKLIFSILSITVLGVIFAMISHDHKLLILSAGVAITGGVKTCSFYRQVSRQQYECHEGLLVQEQVNIHRKRHAIVLELENGSHVQRVLDGRFKLKAGSLYRFYLKKPTNDLPNLPEEKTSNKEHCKHSIPMMRIPEYLNLLACRKREF